MNKILLTWTLLCSVVFLSRAQVSWPSPYNLSQGNYNFSSWPSTSVSGTYPANMSFYRMGTQFDPVESDTIIENYTDGYNVGSGPRINGLDDNGISFINTGAAINKLGAAVLALNTINRDHIAVTWTGRTVTPNNRKYEIRMYYRVGDAGVWQVALDDQGDTVRYERNDAADHLGTLTAILPSAADNQPLVQICWKYFQSYDNTASGTRAELGIKNILISSGGSASPLLTINKASLKTMFALLGGTSDYDDFEISGSGLTSDAHISPTSGFEIATSATGPYSDHITLTQSGGTIPATKIYVRFVSAALGITNGSVSIGSVGAGTQTVSLTGYTPYSTTPQPFVLKNADFSFDNWSATADAGTYPAHMIFHATNVDAPVPTTLPLIYDWPCRYDVPSRSRIKGLNERGFSFVNTGSPQYDDCVSGDVVKNTYVGGASLAINADGTLPDKLKFTASLERQSDGATKRVYSVRVQYRLNTNSAFNDLDPLVEYSSAGRDSADFQNFDINLPASFEDQAYIEFRWLYYAQNISGAGGTRPEIRVDDIQVTRKIIGVHDVSIKSILAYPNPVKSGSRVSFSEVVNGKVTDIYGRTIAVLNNASTLDTDRMAAGIYILSLKSGQMVKLAVE